MSDSEREAELMRCPECGGECIETVLRGNVALMGPDDANNWNPFATRLSALNARTCTNCGYTRLYATRPEKLR